MPNYKPSCKWKREISHLHKKASDDLNICSPTWSTVLPAGEGTGARAMLEVPRDRDGAGTGHWAVISPLRQRCPQALSLPMGSLAFSISGSSCPFSSSPAFCPLCPASLLSPLLSPLFYHQISLSFCFGVEQGGLASSWLFLSCSLCPLPQSLHAPFILISLGCFPLASLPFYLSPDTFASPASPFPAAHWDSPFPPAHWLREMSLFFLTNASPGTQLSGD